MPKMVGNTAIQNTNLTKWVSVETPEFIYEGKAYKKSFECPILSNSSQVPGIDTPELDDLDMPWVTEFLEECGFIQRLTLFNWKRTEEDLEMIKMAESYASACVSLFPHFGIQPDDQRAKVAGLVTILTVLADRIVDESPIVRISSGLMCQEMSQWVIDAMKGNFLKVEDIPLSFEGFDKCLTGFNIIHKGFLECVPDLINKQGHMITSMQPAMYAMFYTRTRLSDVLNIIPEKSFLNIRIADGGISYLVEGMAVLLNIEIKNSIRANPLFKNALKQFDAVTTFMNDLMSAPKELNEVFGLNSILFKIRRFGMSVDEAYDECVQRLLFSIHCFKATTNMLRETFPNDEGVEMFCKLTELTMDDTFTKRAAQERYGCSVRYYEK